MPYNKRFITLNKDDNECCDIGATGYCKIETRDDKTRIEIFIQGLKQLENEFVYKIYLVSQISNVLISKCLGKIEIIKNKGEFSFNIETHNVLETNIDISKFSIIAVCVESLPNKQYIKFPLVGYDNIPKNQEWKKSITTLTCDKKEFINKESKENNTKKIENIDDTQYYIKYLRQGNFIEVSKLMETNKYAQEYKPFDNVKFKYNWWKINDIRFFQNIFCFSFVSRKVFCHPLILKMLRNSKYCLFGIVSDKDQKIKYISFGFPNKYCMSDQISIGGFASFYPTISREKKNGEYGYWVIHIRIDNDSIVMNF